MNREQEAHLIILYKYFYRPMSISELNKEVNESGLLDMTHIEFEDYRSKLFAEKQAMLKFFERSEEWVKNKLNGSLEQSKEA